MSNTIRKTLDFDNQGYYTKHLEIINPILPMQMTPREVEVLSAFMALEGENAEEDRFGTYCRKKVKASTGLSNGGLANYLRSLKEKGFIIEDENNQYSILNFLYPEKSRQNYEFSIINNSK